MSGREEWRPTKWPGYEASSLGRVRSLRRGPARVLNANADNRGGYLYICLYGKKNEYVHALVAEAFHGPRPPGAQIRHLDGDQLNNRPENLAYGSASDNTLDQVRHGRHAEARRTHCPQNHPYDERNTSYYMGWRRCRACDAQRQRDRHRRKAVVK